MSYVRTASSTAVDESLPGTTLKLHSKNHPPINQFNQLGYYPSKVDPRAVRVISLHKACLHESKRCNTKHMTQLKMWLNITGNDGKWPAL